MRATKNLNAINTLFWQKPTVSTLVEMSLSSHKHRLTIMNISKWISTVLAFALLHVSKAKKVGRKTKQKIIRIWNKRVKEVKIAETKISVHACFAEFYSSPLWFSRTKSKIGRNTNKQEKHRTGNDDFSSFEETLINLVSKMSLGRIFDGARK